MSQSDFKGWCLSSVSEYKWNGAADNLVFSVAAQKVLVPTAIELLAPEEAW